MERPVKGDVVVVPFPFSDLSAAKRRPALVLSVLAGSDLILSEITSRPVKDSYFVGLSKDDFASGGLQVESYVRLNKIFTAKDSIVLYNAGRVTKGKRDEAIRKVVEILKQ
ncbi:MAG: type II toxin-antitoxin system PemK/MazF family toxin [Candidatus Diapherotrites archaeon]|nr:type II toxin-antitoxin system PemK/MazF family toxin [Candidatus Diapherotrites archaeon]